MGKKGEKESLLFPNLLPPTHPKRTIDPTPPKENLEAGKCVGPGSGMGAKAWLSVRKHFTLRKELVGLQRQTEVPPPLCVCPRGCGDRQ